MHWCSFGLMADPVLKKSSMKESTEILPPCKFLYEDAPLCSPAEECFACSAVIPSLPLTIKWLRDSVQENPSIRVQVRIISLISFWFETTWLNG